MSIPDEWEAPFFEVLTQTSVETGLGPALSQLPGEIRNIIYSYLLSNGHLQFLRASKALFVEGIGRMAANGVCRVHIGNPARINCIPRDQRIVEAIRNLEIRVDLSPVMGRWKWEDGPHWAWPIEAFAEPEIARGQCSVTLDVYTDTDKRLLAILCGRLRLLSDFETVVVRVRAHEYDAEPSVDGCSNFIMRKAKKEWLKQRETAAVPWSVFVCRFIYNLHEFVNLKWKLGKGVLKGQDESSFRLVFHPLKAQAERGYWRTFPY